MIVARCGRWFLTRRCLCRAEQDSRRLFLPGFTKPGSAVHFGAVWEDLAEALDRLGDVDIDVIIDCGRMGPAGTARGPARAQCTDRGGRCTRLSARS